MAEVVNLDIPKLAKRLAGNRKGVSPVISTIIIVAIAIAISIAVALYLTGIVGTFTRFERLDVTSAYADIQNNTHYVASMAVKNSGTSIITIDRVLINGKPTTFFVNWTANDPSSGTTQLTPQVWPMNITLDGSAASTKIITVATGDSGTIDIYLSKNVYRSGQSLELTFHSVGGKEYPKVLVIP